MTTTVAFQDLRRTNPAVPALPDHYVEQVTALVVNKSTYLSISVDQTGRAVAALVSFARVAGLYW
jgi:hypothetical protein